MPFKIHDGYTLPGKTSGFGNSTDEPMPVLSFIYRPPTAEEATDFRFQQQHAADGKQLYAVRVAFLVSRLCSWDLVGPDDGPLPVSPENARRLPEAVFLDAVGEVSKWKPKPQEEAAKNS